MPKKTKSQIQPLDQGIIANFNVHYKCELVKGLVSLNKSVNEYLKALILKDYFYMAGTAWGKFTPKTINNCRIMHALGPVFQKPNNIDPPARSDKNDDEFLGLTKPQIDWKKNWRTFCTEIDSWISWQQKVQIWMKIAQHQNSWKLMSWHVKLYGTSRRGNEPQSQQLIELEPEDYCSYKVVVQLMQLNNPIYLVKKIRQLILSSRP